VTDVAIAGSAVVPIGLYAQPEEDLIMRCVVAAAADAGVSRSDIRGIIAMATRPQSVQQYQAAHIASRLRLDIEFLAELEVSALGLCSALRLAESVIRDRDIPAVVIVGASRESLVPTVDFLEHRTSRTTDASFVGPFGMAPIAWCALGARQLLASGEATEEDFAAVSVRLRRNASMNPVAYFRAPITAEDVMASRMVAAPLRLLMICPRADGAGAIMVVRPDVAALRPTRAAVHLAQGLAHDGDNVISEQAGRSFCELPSTRVAAEDAFNRAGIDYSDVDVVEPWVPFTPMEIMVMRGLGFPRDYWTTTEVSPSGGLVSRGHPLLATGFYNVHEVIQQLRGEAGPRQVDAARVGLTVSESGNFNGCAVDVFGRLDGRTAN
jgi:acetyl-CoA acetyltransferase